MLLGPPMMLVLRAWRHRTWRVALDWSIAVFLAVAVLYVALVVVAFPTYLPNAAIQQQVYFAWDRAWLTVLDQSRAAMTALALAVVLAALAPLEQRPRTPMQHACVAAAGCLLLSSWQKKAWSYHLLPAIVLSAFVLSAFVLAGTAIVTMLGSRWWRRSDAPALAVCLAVVLAAVALAGSMT